MGPSPNVFTCSLMTPRPSSSFPASLSLRPGSKTPTLPGSTCSRSQGWGACPRSQVGQAQIQVKHTDHLQPGAQVLRKLCLQRVECSGVTKASGHAKGHGDPGLLTGVKTCICKGEELQARPGIWSSEGYGGPQLNAPPPHHPATSPIHWAYSGHGDLIICDNRP